MKHPENTSPTPEAPSFKSLSKEEIDALTPHERTLYRYDRDITNLEEDIHQAEVEIEILTDMAFTADKNEITEEKKQEFVQRFNRLKRFQKGPTTAETFVDFLMRNHKAEENDFNENINALHQYINGWRSEIDNEKKQRQEYLDETYSVVK